MNPLLRKLLQDQVFYLITMLITMYNLFLITYLISINKLINQQQLTKKLNKFNIIKNVGSCFA